VQILSSKKQDKQFILFIIEKLDHK